MPLVTVSDIASTSEKALRSYGAREWIATVSYTHLTLPTILLV